MNVRWTVTSLAIMITLASSAAAQTREDSSAVTNAFVRFVLSERRDFGKPGYVEAIVVDSGSTAWGAYAARVLRSALPSSVAPRSDTARYYALRIALESISISGEKATAWATWSLCNQRGVGDMLNWSGTSIAYSLVRTDTSWVVTEGRALRYLDGHCDAYPGRQ